MGTKKVDKYGIVKETGSGVYNGRARSENFLKLKLEIYI